MNYKEVSCKFVEYYYGTFNKKYQNQVTQRENLGQLYNAESLLSYQDDELAGKDQIMEYLLSDRLSHQVKEPISYHSIPSENNCVFIQVVGDTYFNDGIELSPRLSFAESFYIKLSAEFNSFTVKTQIFSTNGV